MITPGCTGTLPLCSIFTFYSNIQLFHTDTRSLACCIVSLFLLLSSSSLMSTQQLKDILKWKPEHVTLLLNGFLATLESNPRPLPGPARSCQIWSKFIIYHSLPSSLYSVTWPFVLFCQCVEAHACLGTFAQNALPRNICMACSVSASCFLLK